MMQVTNQKCNALQSLVGVFLQSCNVSDQTRNFLAHLGVSVSVTSINRSIRNLSKKAYHEIQRLGATLQASYAYDNLDINLTHSTPTLERSITDTLVHLTTASMFPLHPMTVKSDLDHTDRLRELAVNPPLPSTVAQVLASLPPEYNKLNEKKQSIQDQFNAWKFLADLIAYGPSSFQSFREMLGDPEEIDCIPLVKMEQVPLRASRTGPSTPARNATVIEEFFRQSNIGEYTEPLIDSEDPPSQPLATNNAPANLGNQVILMFGDQLTGQHLRSLQDSRIDDATPGTRFEALLFCPGWFHVRMACVDAIWRRHIKDRDPEASTTNLMKYIMQI